MIHDRAGMANEQPAMGRHSLPLLHMRCPCLCRSWTRRMPAQAQQRSAVSPTFHPMSDVSGF